MKGKPFKDTKVGQWLKGNAPEILDQIDDYFPPAKILTALVKGTSIPDDKKLEFEKLLMDNEKELYQLEISDRISARDMYKHNSELQKVYAIAFLIGYMALTFGAGIMVWNMAKNQFHIADWAIAFISSIWGALSMKVSTINDFLFGSSYGKEERIPDIKQR